MKVLGLCGSLRKHSRSLALLEATSILASGQIEFRIFNGLGNLPLFNPDIEHVAPSSVHALWEAVNWADTLIIASPEYAHGVTGTIKNALDWLVGYVPFVGKPVAVFNPSHRAEHADESLKETLRTMNACLISEACVRIPSTGSELSANGMASSSEFSNRINSTLVAITRFHLSQSGQS
ncbi:NADPH-dependent FMN reductase [Hydrogenophaga sp.]|uniref:NADPH-dependent FMN reductase n=1 Tax=Hydrogenophaga sp. TaxID=1904254 RepID=UPI0035B156F3